MVLLWAIESEFFDGIQNSFRKRILIQNFICYSGLNIWKIKFSELSKRDSNATEFNPKMADFNRWKFQQSITLLLSTKISYFFPVQYRTGGKLWAQ